MSVKKGVEIRFNDVLDTKQFFFVYKNKIIQSLKKAMLLVKKCQFFVYLGLVKIRQEIMLNDFAEKRETFLTLKDRIFQSPKNAFFQRD